MNNNTYGSLNSRNAKREQSTSSYGHYLSTQSMRNNNNQAYMTTTCETLDPNR